MLELGLRSTYFHGHYPGPSLCWIKDGHTFLDSSPIERFYTNEIVSLLRYRLYVLYMD